MFKAELLDRFLSFIEERDRIRQKRAAGLSAPWTADPTLARFRFCNVHREDDKITRLIKRNVRGISYRQDSQVIPAVMLARLINREETLNVLFPFFKHRPEIIFGNPSLVLEEIKKRIPKPPYITGAYIIRGWEGYPKLEGVFKVYEYFLNNSNYENYVENNRKTLTCQEMLDWFIQFPCIGSFTAAQFIADLKYTSILKRAQDWEDFVAPGPGSLLGMVILTEGSLEKYLITVEYLRIWKENIKKLKEITNDHFHALRREGGLNVEPFHAQDIQNCLCEFSKYFRGKGRQRYIIKPNDEEERVINAGIVADSDNPEWIEKDFTDAI